jgi:hypothetical protein
LVAVPYALIALLVAFFTRLSADLTVAVATLNITLGASLPWLFFLLPVGGALGALGGYIVKDRDKDVSAARPQRTFLLTGIISAMVLLLSSPSLMFSGPSGTEELAASSLSAEDSPIGPLLAETVPTQGESAPGKLDLEAPPGDSKSSPSRQPKAERQSTDIGEPVVVGDMEWVVTRSRRENQITAESGDILQGDFVIVDFDLTNNSDEQVRLTPSSFGLIGSQGRRFEIISRMARYVPPERSPGSRPVAPGDKLTGRVVFEVEPKASGFRLQLGDGRRLPQENGYVDLGV